MEENTKANTNEKDLRIEEKKTSSEGSILIPKISPVEFKVDERKKELKVTKSKKGKIVKGLAIVAGVILVLVFLVGILFYRVYQKALKVQASVNNLNQAVAEQDLEKIKKELATTKTALQDLKTSYRSVSWAKYVPFVGSYVSDGEHAVNAGVYGIEAGEIVIEAVGPYADIIGFSSNSDQSQSGEQTTQERLDFIVKSIPDLIPKTDALVEKVSLVRKEVAQIDPERYPEKIGDKEIKVKVKKLVDLVDESTELVEKGKPLLEAAPYLLGADKERLYLIIFQNDKELRPTGGFITAYATARVKKGRFEPVSSSDIYNLDSTYKPKVKAPDAVIKYLKGPYLLSKNLRLRDMNWSPDFSESMGLFTKEIETVGIDDVDGVIAVDTQVLVNILNVTGPIGVPGFGTFGTNIVPECNCPQVIYELESFADIEGPVVWSQDEPGKIIYAPPNYDNRKKIIGPLMNSILANALGQPKDKLPALFEAGIKSLTEKHVLFYQFDPKAQEAVEEFGIGGVISEYDGDYLHINDANLGGRKSNLYVTQEVSQEIEIAKDGSVVKSVTITYKNPEKHDGWLNSVLPNWVRVYVPKGSELLSFDGVNDKEEPYEELGKTVFAGFFEIRPQGVAKVNIKYKLPFKVDKEYKFFIQKQPGKDTSLYTIKIGKKEEEFFLKTDKELKFRI